MALAENKRSVMTLYSSKSDLYSHQVRIVLAEKGVQVDIKLLDNGDFPAELKQFNPQKSVPMLVDRDLSLYDSRIIMEYLDERFPHPPLLPVYPVARAESRLIMHRIEKNWYYLADKITQSKGKDADMARQKLLKEILLLGPVFGEFDYFMSHEFSLADCYLAPLLWRLPELEIELTGTSAREIKSYMNRVFARDNFLASLTDNERKIRLTE